MTGSFRDQRFQRSMIEMSEYTQTDALSEIGVLSALDNAAKRSIAAECSWHNIKQDQQIIGHLDRSDDVYFLVQGTVRAISYSFDGKEVSFRDIGPGEIFGEYAAIDGGERSANIFTLTEIFAGSLSGRVFRDLLARYPEVSLAVMRLLTRKSSFDKIMIAAVFFGLRPAAFDDQTLDIGHRPGRDAKILFPQPDGAIPFYGAHQIRFGDVLGITGAKIF